MWNYTTCVLINNSLAHPRITGNSLLTPFHHSRHWPQGSKREMDGYWLGWLLDKLLNVCAKLRYDYNSTLGTQRKPFQFQSVLSFLLTGKALLGRTTSHSPYNPSLTHNKHLICHLSGGILKFYSTAAYVWKEGRHHNRNEWLQKLE